MKQRQRTEWAARLVQRAYRGWKRRRFLLRLAHHRPPESPLSREWPRAPPPCHQASALLYKLYHKWRVRHWGGMTNQVVPRRRKKMWKCSLESVFSGFGSSLLRFSCLGKSDSFQCHKYRMRFDQTSRNRMREKVTSSIIFKGRKASYAKR